MATQLSSSFPGGNINAHIAEELLELAKRSVIFQQLGSKAKMPSGEGKTFQFNRYERLSLPRLALSEGVDPSSSAMSLSTVSATADQWGAYIELSDVAVLTIKHPLLKIAIELLGYQAAELVDREVIQVLQAGTNVSFGGAASLRSGLSTASTDSLSDAVVQKAVARLRQRGAHPYEGQHYVGVLDPSMEQDVSQSANSAFTQAAAYSNIKALYNGEIGSWRGARWMTSNFIPVNSGVAAETYTTPIGGSFAAASYRISTGYYNAETGMLEKLSQNTAVAFAALDQLAGTAPVNTSYVYKIFVGLAGGAAPDVMYQGIDAVAGSGFIAAGAAISVLAPPVSGASIAGSDIPATGKNVHTGWIIGKQAFCTVDLQNLQVMVSKAEATTDNPLLLRRTVGYKLMFKPVIQNNSFMERIEVLSQFE